ncbi:MAG: menaquinol-cytochrome c reductase cytochrome b subunit [Acidimicrobiia bacterium]|nr:menaquinol-cytochrome c reductase cytochrome b subunit [Acidimicrobiia bacterium]
MGLAPEGGSAPAAAPAGEPAAAPVAEAVAPEPAAAAPAAADPGGAALEGFAAMADVGVPESLIERSTRARAKADGIAVPGAAPAAPVAAGGGGGAAAAPAAAPVAAIPAGVRTQRLLTVVKANAIQQVKKEPHDKVNTWPHLVAAEFVALMVMTAFLLVFSVFVDAPLLELANFNEQPNPSKAPWYFLGLQELLSYFDPQVAGVIIPGFGIAAIAFIPYIDKNPSVRPNDRKLAIMIFTFFVMASAILTIFGSFFRGPGFNFTYPWADGIFFDF